MNGSAVGQERYQILLVLAHIEIRLVATIVGVHHKEAVAVPCVDLRRQAQLLQDELGAWVSEIDLQVLGLHGLQRGVNDQLER